VHQQSVCRAVRRARDSVRTLDEHMFVSAQPPPIPLLKNQGRPPSMLATREVRDCPRHGRVVFHRYKAGRDGYRWRCKRCVGEAVTRRHQKVKRILVAEAGSRCALCGYDRCPVSLHFHHVDPSAKSFAINQSAGKSLAAYRAEAQKCVLVCANCHGEIEMGIVACPPAGARYGAPN
jgi:hypothetical protein